jgi:hypothetical protein
MTEFENTYDERTEVWTAGEDRYQGLLRSSPEYERLRGGGCTDAEDAWGLLLKLISEIHEADYQMYDFVGAGPLEDFVRYYGESWIGRIEAEASSNPRFLRCLSHVWLSEGDLSKPVVDRLLAASHGTIPVFPRTNPLSEAL